MNFYEIDKLNSHQLLSDKIVFCLSPKHPLASKKELSIEMLRDENLIMYNTDSVLNSTLYSRFKGIGSKPNVIMHASQLYTIQKFLQNSSSCTSHPFSYLTDCIIINPFHLVR